jgi:hypothetical protein
MPFQLQIPFKQVPNAIGRVFELGHLSFMIGGPKYGARSKEFSEGIQSMLPYIARRAVWLIVYLLFVLAPVLALLLGKLPPAHDFLD